MKKSYWVLDTEDDSKGKVWLINFYNGVEHFTFTTRGEALNWLLSRTEVMEIWCVNLQYDLVNTFGNTLSELEIIFVGSRVISAQFKNKRVQFRDTLNHWKISVAEMGKRIGLKKLRVLNGNFNDIKYCRRDCEVTFKFLMTMKSHYESIGCRLKRTIGSTALDFYYSQYGTRVKKPMDIEQLKFCIGGYYGGRTEIFFNKPIEGNIFYFDINSLYPFAMLNEFPALDSGRFVKRPKFEREGMAEVTVECPKMRIPYLPWRSDVTGRLLFATGVFRGTYTYFEIREALKLGYRLRKAHRALEFSGKCRPFDNFVRDLYTRRLGSQQSGDSLLSDCYKLLMNNLYGKFGQKNINQSLIPISKTTLKTGDQIYGNMVLRTEIGDYPRHSNGIWSAYTTAYGRHALHAKLLEVEARGGLLIYCDTDSVIFESDEPIFENSKELGKLKLEGEFDYAHFKLPKVYTLRARGEQRYRYKAKGIPKTSARAFIRSGRAEFRRPFKIKETLRRNLSPRRVEPLIMNYWELTHKELTQIYNKRIVFKTGHTEPLEIKN